MTSDRDRLIELFEAVEKDPAITCPHYKTDKTCDTCKYTINNYLCNHTERTVDYLLANGVIVPPEELYSIVDKVTIYATVSKVLVEMLPLYVIKEPEKYGYYKTKEEAEEKLKELQNNA